MEREQVDKVLLKDKDFRKRFKRLMGVKEAHIQRNLARLLGTWTHPVRRHALWPTSRRVAARPRCRPRRCTWPGPSRSRRRSASSRRARPSARRSRGAPVRSRPRPVPPPRGRKMPEFHDAMISIVKRSRHDYAGLYAVWALKHTGYNGRHRIVRSRRDEEPQSPDHAGQPQSHHGVVDGQGCRRPPVADQVLQEGPPRRRRTGAGPHALARNGTGRRRSSRTTSKKRADRRQRERREEDPRLGTSALPDPELEGARKGDRPADHDGTSTEARPGKCATRHARDCCASASGPRRRSRRRPCPATVDSIRTIDTALTATELCGVFGAEEAYARPDQDRPATRTTA